MITARSLAAALLSLTLASCATADPVEAVQVGQKWETGMARLNYVELPAMDMPTAKRFYEQAFGWSLTEFAPTYAATLTGKTDLGLDADPAERPKAPLPVIEVPDLEAALRSVKAAGGKIIRPIFSFPGGRRFHFLDPSGNEVAAWQAAQTP